MYRYVLLMGLFVESMTMASAQLEVPGVIDLGLLPRIKIITREVEYKNVGTEDLVIGKWSKSCGCMDVTMGKLKLSPGESSKFLLKIDAGLFIPGSVRVVLYTNEPENGEWTVKIKYAFHDPLIIYPPVLYLEKKKNIAVSSDIHLIIKEGIDYKIKEVVAEEKIINIPDLEIIKENNYRLNIPIPSDLNQNLDFKIIITPTEKDFGSYEIPVKLRIEPDVKFYPKKLIINADEAQTPKKLLAKFRMLTESPKAIKKITSDLDLFTFEINKNSPTEYVVSCFGKEGLKIETKYVESYMNVFFEGEADAYILPVLYVQSH